MGASGTTDVVVIGAGHNGLVCAGYLARAGLSVTVLERRPVVGGAAVTEEFHPGFRNSVYSYVVSLLHPEVIADLELGRHGLAILERPSGSFCPQPDGRHLLVSKQMAVAKAEITKFSNRDADRYEALDHVLTDVAAVVRSFAAETPPNIAGGWRDAAGLLLGANRLRRLPADRRAELARLMTMSVGDYLDRWFDSDPIKGHFGFEGIVGNMVSPYQAGSAYVLLHHAFGEVNGKVGAWGHARGGMGAITQAMAKSAAARGVLIETGAPVARVLVERGAARGVMLEDGRTIRARAVASNLNPKLLFSRLVDGELLAPDFRDAMAAWRCRSGSFRMNVALSELPRFPSLSGEDDAASLMGTINIAPSLAYLDRAFDDARTLGWSREPVVSMCIPSTVDDSLAPAGRHVASLFCQHFNPDLPGGRSWDEVREEVADLVVATVDRYAPNFRRSILGRQIKTPLDLERDLGLVGGDIFHGALHLDQIWSLRPAPGHADYRAPIKGLYLCGSGSHPGGGVSGLPGRNAAREIAKDFRRRKVAA
jgi:phytoene dehydrogenase-like protein